MPWEVQVFKDVLMTPQENYVIQAAPRYIDDPYFYMHPEEPVIKKLNPGWRIIKEGEAQGRLIGGHIGTLLALAGTKYWPDLKGKILFLEEDEGGSAKNLRRLMRQIEQIGVLDEINGLLISRIPEVTGIKGDLWFGSLVEDIIERLDYPIVAEMDFGHTNPITTLPVGVKAEISTEKQMLTLLEPSVR